MNYKFEIGDLVKVVHYGSGVGSGYKERYGVTKNKFKIVEKGEYGDGPGYKVEPKIGNCVTGMFNGFVGEDTFELIRTKPKTLRELL